MIIELTAANSPLDVHLPTKAAEATVASVGTWAGTITMGYKILTDGEIQDSPVYGSADYEDGAFTDNFNKVFHPASDITTFTLDGTGTAYIRLQASKWSK